MSLARRRWARGTSGVAGGLAAASFALVALAAPAAADDDGSYTVQAGDTLWDIAAHLDVPVSALEEANATVDAELLVTGSRLTIPSADESDEVGPSTPRDTSRATYIIRPGDTWSAIAARYSMRLSQLAAANDTTPDAVLFVGDELTIPALDVGGVPPTPTSTVSYTVRPGDTLTGIALRHGTTAGRLAEDNGLSVGGFLRVGVTLQVEGAAAALDASAVANLPAKIRDDPERLALLPVFDAAAAEFGVPADLLKSVGYMESGWKPDVISYVGAMGVGQLMPDTAADLATWLGDPDLDPWNPVDNLRMSAKYLRILLDLNGGNSDAALAAYYQGQQSVQVNGMYEDTQRYVQVIQANRALFR